VKKAILISCLVACLGTPALPADSREERLRKQRREESELDWEWRRKFEDDWKSYHVRTDKVYRRWTIASKEKRKEYDADRKARGLDPVPWKFMHR
jgi:hypothetical protein